MWLKIYKIQEEVVYNMAKNQASSLSGAHKDNYVCRSRSKENIQFSSVAQSCPTLCDPMNRSTPASLPVTNSWSPPKPVSIESMVSSNHLILYRPLLLPPSTFPSIRVFSNESVLHIKWPKYWSLSFSISPSNEYSIKYLTSTLQNCQVI